MARQRNYKAEYRARIERAKNLGLSKQQAAGHAKRANLPSLKQLRASGVIPPASPVRRQPKVTPLPQVAPGAATYNTVDARVIKQAVEDARAQGLRVSFRLTVDTPNGPRTRTLTGGGDQGYAAGAGEAGAGGGDVRDGLHGKITVNVGPASMVGGGFDPDDLLDEWDDYDLWAWFDDMIDDIPS